VNERRTWNTPIREPWNPVVHQLLKAVDEHGRMFRATGDPFHAREAEQLRQYLHRLKTWIHACEAEAGWGSIPAALEDKGES
jgi:hypothetical protein